MQPGQLQHSSACFDTAVCIRRLTHVMLLPWLLVLASCTSPGVRFAEQARLQGLQADSLMAGDFRLRLYRHSGTGACPQLHVYLDGDGAPWLSRNHVSPDPTPRDTMLLRLMAVDSAPSIYLGRPCHHGQAGEPPCRPWLWTHGRYSETIVAALTEAIRHLQSQYPQRPLVLIGHSGGGTLAYLLAARLEVDTLVTLAGNLDVESWTRLHGYTSLQGLDPAQLPPLPEKVRQLHLAGAKDDNVPPSLTRAALGSSPRAELRILPGMGHLGPFDELWPEVIGRLCADSGSAHLQ